MGNGCSKSSILLLSLRPDHIAAGAATDNDDDDDTAAAARGDKQSFGAATAAAQGTNGGYGSSSSSVSVADSKDNAVPIAGHNDGKKKKYVLRQVPIDAISDGGCIIDLIVGSLSQEVLFQLLLVFRQQCSAERRRILSPRIDSTTAADAATRQSVSSHNMMMMVPPSPTAGSTSRTKRVGSGSDNSDLLLLLDRSYKRLSLNKDSLYSLFPSIHSLGHHMHHRQLIQDLLLLYEQAPMDPSISQSQPLITTITNEEFGLFMRGCILVTPAQLLRAFQIASHLPALLRDLEATSGKDLLD